MTSLSFFRGSPLTQAMQVLLHQFALRLEWAAEGGIKGGNGIYQHQGQPKLWVYDREVRRWCPPSPLHHSEVALSPLVLYVVVRQGAEGVRYACVPSSP